MTSLVQYNFRGIWGFWVINKLCCRFAYVRQEDIVFHNWPFEKHSLAAELQLQKISSVRRDKRICEWSPFKTRSCKTAFIFFEFHFCKMVLHSNLEMLDIMPTLCSCFPSIFHLLLLKINSDWFIDYDSCRHMHFNFWPHNTRSLSSTLKWGLRSFRESKFYIIGKVEHIWPKR